jgi:nitrogen fixation NifU-like protein
MIYSEKLVDHFQHPRNVGSFDKSKLDVGTGIVGSGECGDLMQIQIKVNDQARIIDARFKTFGCGSAIASSSVATELVKGKTLDEALAIKNIEIARELALPPAKVHCSVLAEDALQAAVADLKSKRSGAGLTKQTAATGPSVHSPTPKAIST